MKKILTLGLLGFVALVLAACSEADTASHNLSQSSDSFQVERRIVFFNGITDEYLLTVEGLCSIDLERESNISVTCKTGDDEYKKHYLGLSDNVSYFVEQLRSNPENPMQYKVLFRPTSIVPDIETQLDGEEVEDKE